jgi:hypothetical protein
VSRYTSAQITDGQALKAIAGLLDGREWSGADDLQALAAIVRRAGRQVRSPEEIAVRCPSCGSPDITLDYEAGVAIRIKADRVERVTLGGFTGSKPVCLFCADCGEEHDLREHPEGTDRSRLGEVLTAAAGLIPDRYEDETTLQEGS